MKLRLVSGQHRRPSPQALSLREFWERRNTVLVVRQTGGVGDLLMHRMVFEDFKLLAPEVRVVFACPERYRELVIDHPFIDEVVDSETVETADYLKSFDTTTICGRTEMANAPGPSPHRSDIWASWCGLTLTRHNMHIRLSEDERARAREMVAAVRCGAAGPAVALAPISAISSKNLDQEQFNAVARGLREMGLFVYGLHEQAIDGLDAPTLVGRNIRNFLSLVDAADMVVSVDSAAFHAAGGMGKRLVGVFGWADGRVYGKYYRNWELVQRHRDDGDWSCGPCYTWGQCTRCPDHMQVRKPCITEISPGEILAAAKRVLSADI